MAQARQAALAEPGAPGSPQPAASRTWTVATRTTAPFPAAQPTRTVVSSGLRPGVEPWFMSLQIENRERRRDEYAIRHMALSAKALARPQIGQRHRVMLLSKGGIFVHCDLLLHAVQPMHLNCGSRNRGDFPRRPRLAQTLARLAHLFEIG